MSERSAVFDKWQTIILDAKYRADNGLLSDTDRQAVTHIMACATYCGQVGSLDAAGYVLDALPALFAQRDREAAERANPGSIVAFPDPPGRRALVEAVRPMQPPRYQAEKMDPLGWLLKVAKIDSFPDEILLRMAREWYGPQRWMTTPQSERVRPKPIELREMAKSMMRGTRRVGGWQR